MSHDHSFISWPFNASTNTAAFTTKQIMEDEYQIAEIYHDHDGEWQFLCGTTLESNDLKVVCLGCMVERFPLILEFADIPVGHCAIFDAHKNVWLIESYQDSDEKHL